jgi:hypothetical protein
MSGVPVENQWKSGGKLIDCVKNCIAWYLFYARANNADVSACVYGPVLQILQNDLRQGRFFSPDGSLVSNFCSRLER